MTDRLNKTSICSIIFLDIIDYSKKSVSEQFDDKALFNELINEAIKSVAQTDRIILDTGDGAAITLMGAPEEALFIALIIRDGILDHNKNTEQSLLVRIGINLGSVRVVNDINDRPNIIGDGINVAQRIMSFAGENQILVSRSYYEVTSRLTKEMTGMFTYSGIKQDKHIREHEVYLIKPKDGQEVKEDEVKVADIDVSTTAAEATEPAQKTINKHYWKLLIGAILLVSIIIIWYFSGVSSKSTTPLQAVDQKTSPPSLVVTPKIDQPKTKDIKTNPLNLKVDTKHVPLNDSKANKADVKKQADITPIKKKPIVKVNLAHEEQASKVENKALKIRQNEARKAIQVEKKVIEKNCSQAQISMNQCK